MPRTRFLHNGTVGRDSFLEKTNDSRGWRRKRKKRQSTIETNHRTQVHQANREINREANRARTSRLNDDRCDSWNVHTRAIGTILTFVRYVSVEFNNAEKITDSRSDRHASLAPIASRTEH